MVLIQAFKVAIRTVWAIKDKSFISVATIAVGSLAITSTFTIAMNLESYVNMIIEKSGGPKIEINSYHQDEGFTKHQFKTLRKISSVKSTFGSTESNIKRVRFEDRFNYFQIPDQ